MVGKSLESEDADQKQKARGYKQHTAVLVTEVQPWELGKTGLGEQQQKNS